MRLLTIGFKGKSAREFFAALKGAGVEKLLDVRRRNVSQLAGFTKGPDLRFFLEECFGIVYEHVPEFGPSEELLKEYRARVGKKKPDDAAWEFYVRRYRDESLSAETADRFAEVAGDRNVVCLLCSEETAEHCHRRLLAEYLRDQRGDVEIRHL